MATPSKRLPGAVEYMLPNLQWPDNYNQESDKNGHYNCIAWALGVTTVRYWPNTRSYSWPSDVPNEETPEAFVQFFATKGYERCNTSDLEDGFERTAIYTHGTEVLHAAKQKPSGRWTSKLGHKGEDIEHHSLRDIEGGLIWYWDYGSATIFMRRPYG